jgi:hypothetical protein
MPFLFVKDWRRCGINNGVFDTQGIGGGAEQTCYAMESTISAPQPTLLLI